MKIKKVEIQAFRAYKSKENGTFDLTFDGENPSNFVSIFAPNGFGKSSFYDAIEWGMTNNILRYLHEETRRNNDLAAKGTRSAGQPQFILRNKDVDDKTPTSVHIDTTLKPFDRVLKTARNGTRDFQFNESQTEAGSESLRKVILSQDGIERFMREETPQSRYKNFMDYFGGESEKYRKEITVLIGDNQNILAQLDKDKKGLESELSQPFDDSIFDAFNKVAAYLTFLGENVSSIPKYINEKLEQEKLGEVVKRLNELKHSQILSLNRRALLEAQLLKLPEITHIKKEMPELLGKLNSLKSTIKFSEDFEAEQQKVLIGKENLNTCNSQLANLNLVGDAIPKYLFIADELKNAKTTLSKLIESETTLTSNLAWHESSLSAWIDQLADTDKRIRENESLLNDSENLYLQITQAESNKLIFEKILETHELSREIEINTQKNIFAELKQLSEIQVDADTLFSTDLSIFSLDHLDLTEIQQISQQIISLETQIENIELTRQSLQSRLTKIENLILVGLDYLNSNPTNICPLCKIDHNTSDQLKAAIVLSQFNPEIESLNRTSKELEELKRQLQSQLTGILDRIKNKRSLKITELQTILLNCSNNLSKLDSDQLQTSTELVKIDHALSNLKSQTSNLSASELTTKLSSEMADLNRQKETLDKQISNTNQKIKELSFQLVINQSETSKLITLQTELEKRTEYKIVEEFINRNGISPEITVEFHNSKVIESRTRIEHVTSELRKTKDFLAELHHKIISENHGLDYRQLIEVKEYTEKQHFDRHSELASYIEASKRALSTESFILDDAEQKFKNEIQINEENLKSIDDKQSNYSLLKDHLEAIRPYVYRTNLSNRLKDLNKNIVNHNLLKAKLEVELAKVLDNLRDQINAFFYTDLINSIYSKIDPHPLFKKIEFIFDTSIVEKPGLNFVITDERGDRISPNLYFSAAQINILSLSVFLANALHARGSNDEKLDVILMDDPIQAMDSINILSTIDLLRNLMIKFNKQIIVSTHDENFFELLKRKIPTEIFNSKFLSLESYGVVKNEK